MRWLCTRELRSMASRPCSSMAGVTFLRLRTVAQPSIAFSGFRSSCDSVARNSSLIWLLRSASVRAARSLASSFSRSVTLVAMAMRAPWPFSATMRHSTSATLPSGRKHGHGAFPAAAVRERVVQCLAQIVMGGRDDVDATLADDVAALAAGDAAELGIHVLVDEVGIEQRDAARSQLEHRAETRIGACAARCPPGARTAARAPWR